MVTSAPPSQSAAQMSWAELLAPMTTARLPRYASGPGCCDEWCWSPLKTSMPSKVGTLALPDIPVASTSCSGPEGDFGAIPLHHDGPSAGVLVVAGALAFGAAPVVELHDLGVHLEPVADLVLRRENRPVLGEVDVGQVVVPDRVVQAQRLVAIPPGVARPRVAVDDDRRHAQLPQPRAQGDAALTAADDHRVGLGGIPELLCLGMLAFQPGLPIRVRAVFGALRAVDRGSVPRGP